MNREVDHIVDDMTAAWADVGFEQSFRDDCVNLIGAVQRACLVAQEAHHATLQQVQEACAQVADRAKIKQDELYQVCRTDPTMTETARDSSLDRIAAKSRMAEQIAKSIRELIPPSGSGCCGLRRRLED